MPTVKLEFFPAQKAVFECEDSRIAYVAGLGSGKTRVASDRVLRDAIRWPKARHFIFSNTFPQLTAGTMKTFFEACDRWGIEYVDRIRTQKCVLLPKIGAKIEVWTADDADLFRSLEIDRAWIDEAHKWSQSAYEKLEGRLRGSETARKEYPDDFPPFGSDRKGSLCLVVTANPPYTMDHWLVRGCTEMHPETGKTYFTLFQSSAFDNYMLPPSYVEHLLQVYDPELADIELGGNFGDIGGGRIWRMFWRQRHVLTPEKAAQLNLPPLEWDPSLPVCWSHDWNIDPLCSILFQWRRIDVSGYQRDVMFVLDEMRIRHAIIDEAVKEFQQRDAYHVARKSGLIIYGDASGAQRSRQTGESDIAALKKSLSAKGFVGDVRIPPQNPSLRDRYNAGNAKLMNAEGKIGVVIHQRCRWLAKDLGAQSYKPGTSLPLVPKAEDGVTMLHHADAWSYPIYREFPITDLKAGRFVGTR